jgi:beta-lactamase class A
MSNRALRRRGTVRAVVGTAIGLSIALLASSCQPQGQAASRPAAASGGQAANAGRALGVAPAGSPGHGGPPGFGPPPKPERPDPSRLPPPPRPTTRAGAPTRSGAGQPPAPFPPSDARRPTFATQGKLAERLQAVVDDAVSRKVASRVGVAVVDMATGQAVGVNANQNFKPASVIKLAVLVGAFRQRSAMQPEQFERLRPFMQRMITISDNPSTRRLVNRLGARQVNASIRELGLNQFRVGESGSRAWVLQGSQATPADTALLLAKLAQREVVNPQASEEMLALLGAQQKRRRIPAGLPPAPDLWVGNKTGTLNGVVNDAGIVLQPRSGIGYTVAVFTAGTRSESAGEQLIADLSAVVYGYMASRSRGS